MKHAVLDTFAGTGVGVAIHSGEQVGGEVAGRDSGLCSFGKSLTRPRQPTSIGTYNNNEEEK